MRVLQEREVERLGGTKARNVRFRLISTSNRDLKNLVRDGKYREDFYFRIAKATIRIPSLRERKEDVPVYIDHFIKIINARFGTKFKRLSNDALSCLMTYDWPGNIRELINILEQACLKQWEGQEIHLNNIPPEVSNDSDSIALQHQHFSRTHVDDKERDLILKTLEETKGNKRKAVSLLGMPRSTLYNKLKDFRINYYRLNQTSAF